LLILTKIEIKIEDYIKDGLLTKEFLNIEEEQLKKIESELNFLRAAVLNYHGINFA
jgi:hypothetical protein